MAIWTAGLIFVAALYQENKVQIDRLTAQLKSDYLQQTTAKDIFTEDSPVQPVFASLTKLEPEFLAVFLLAKLMGSADDGFVQPYQAQTRCRRLIN